MFEQINLSHLSENWKKKLKNAESEVPNDLFDKINAARLSGTWKKQLKDTESEVPNNLFDRIEEVLDKENLKEKLNNYASEVPDNSFARVMEMRQSESIRRPFGLLFGLLLLLLLGMLVTTSTFKKSLLPRYNKKERIEPIKEQVKKQGSDKKDFVVMSENNTDNRVNENNPSRINKKQNKNSEEKISEKRILNLEKNADKNFINSKIRSLNRSASKKINDNQTIYASENLRAIHKNTNSENNLTTKLFDKTVNENANEPIYINGTKPVVEVQKHDDIINQNVLSKNLTINTLPLKTSFLTVKNTFVSPCNGPGDGCPTFGPQTHFNPNKGFFIDAFAGPEYVMRNLTAKNKDFSDYRNFRDTIERPQYAFTSGAGVGYEFKNGIVLRTGILYSVINETARFDSIGVGKVEFTVTTDPTTGLRDTSEKIITNGIFRKTRYNHYSDLNIPVQIGYDIILKNNWSVMLKVGGGFNISSWRKADIAGTDFKLLNQTGNSATDVFKKNIGGYIGGSIAVYKAVDEHLLVGIEPSVRYYLTSFTQYAYPLSQTYFNFGINATAKWKF